MADDPLSITKDDRVRHSLLGDGRVLFRHGAPYENLLTVAFEDGQQMVRDDLLERVKDSR